MPIYAYRCEACGFKKDVLQKLSDAPLRECPSCGQQTFSKALTAPAFQLKGSGWYVTDFRDNASGKKNGEPAAADAAGNDAKPAAEPAKEASASPSSGTGDGASSPAAGSTGGSGATSA
ncbi:MAG: zinc ribbon domain-containing protein [Burkholderiaceae bacterium]